MTFGTRVQSAVMPKIPLGDETKFNYYAGNLLNNIAAAKGVTTVGNPAAILSGARSVLQAHPAEIGSVSLHTTRTTLTMLLGAAGQIALDAGMGAALGAAGGPGGAASGAILGAITGLSRTASMMSTRSKAAAITDDVKELAGTVAATANTLATGAAVVGATVAAAEGVSQATNAAQVAVNATVSQAASTAVTAVQQGTTTATKTVEAAVTEAQTAANNAATVAVAAVNHATTTATNVATAATTEALTVVQGAMVQGVTTATNALAGLLGNVNNAAVTGTNATGNMEEFLKNALGNQPLTDTNEEVGVAATRGGFASLFFGCLGSAVVAANTQAAQPTFISRSIYATPEVKQKEVVLKNSKDVLRVKGLQASEEQIQQAVGVLVKAQQAITVKVAAEDSATVDEAEVTSVNKSCAGDEATSIVAEVDTLAFNGEEPTSPLRGEFVLADGGAATTLGVNPDLAANDVHI